MADRPGVPKPIKLPEPLKPLVSLDEPLSAKNGLALAEWAAGGVKAEPVAEVDTATLETELLTLSERLGKRDAMAESIENRRADPDFAEWLERALVRARGAAASSEAVSA